MAALDGERCILAGDIIDRVLPFVDAGRGFDHGAEDHGHPVGDAAVEARVVVGPGDDPADLVHPERVVGGAKPKPVPNSMPLTAGMENAAWASRLSTLSK